MADSGKTKPGLMLAMLGGSKKAPESADTDTPVADDSEAPDMATSEFDSAAMNAFDALKEDDIEGFKLAFKAAVMACKDEDDSSDY